VQSEYVTVTTSVLQNTKVLTANNWPCYTV